MADIILGYKFRYICRNNLISGFYYIIVPNDYINTAQQVRPKISNTKFLNKVSMCMKANSSS